MADRTGKVILAKNIRLDRDYQFTTDYSESNLVTALQSNAHLVASRTDCSFIRDEGQIEVDVPYGTAIQANYIAFQNPDYSNKWFFAFIDEVKYLAEADVLITYSIDHLSTWYDYWTPKPCFVTREHANTDVAGDNLQPETFELGEYVSNGSITELTGQATQVPPIIGLITSYIPKYPSNTYLSQDLCGLPIPGILVCFQYFEQLTNFLTKLSNDGKNAAVSMVFTINRGTIGLGGLTDTDYWDMYNSLTPETDDTLYFVFKGKNSPFTHYNTLSRPATLNGYTPVNQKLKTFPYMALTITNNSGSSNVLCYEYFSDPTTCRINFDGVPSVGGSILNYPENYKGITYNFREGVCGTKLPTLGWSKDAYTNWLTQNAVNYAGTNLGMVNQIGQSLLGAAFAGSVKGSLGGLSVLGAAVGGISGIAQNVLNITSEKRQHALVPTSVSGNVNNADVLSCGKNYGTYAIPLSIQYQFAERIDGYFTRFGYATNKIKIPNQTGRTNWNYVEIAGGESIGYSTGTVSVPSESMSIINKAYQKGITIFHNIDNIGEFGLTNPIVSNNS